MIFISYRRDDAAGYARAVYDALAQRFGAERVFMDVDDIEAGEAFDTALQRAVGASKVLLVLIGRRWAGEREGQPPRLFDAGDFVRLEVAAALAGGGTVIPVLIDGATMPTAAQLPSDLLALTRRNALELDNSRFAADVERLIVALHESLGNSATRRPVRRLALAGGLLALAAGTLTVFWRQRTPQRPAINGRWLADITYDWPNAHHTERFEFGGEGGDLFGSASFLGVPRGLLEGSADTTGLRFVTRTGELGGGPENVHRYRGRLVDGEIRFVLQTEGGSSAHRSIEFVARPL